jgi:sarcosine oxidase
MGGPEVTAETRTFEPDPQRQRRYRQFLDRHIPRFAGPELYTKTCLYTIPPDQNFVLDTLPADPIEGFSLARPATTDPAIGKVFHT